MGPPKRDDSDDTAERLKAIEKWVEENTPEPVMVNREAPPPHFQIREPTGNYPVPPYVPPAPHPTPNGNGGIKINVPNTVVMGIVSLLFGGGGMVGGHILRGGTIDARTEYHESKLDDHEARLRQLEKDNVRVLQNLEGITKLLDNLASKINELSERKR